LIVIDASALLGVLLGAGIGERVNARVYREEETLHAPHLLDYSDMLSNEWLSLRRS
jgi:predicted nucleic acid-binding protein